MPTNKANKSIWPLIFFIVWPFAAMVLSLKNHRAIWGKNIFWLFCVFYGFTFVIPSEGPDAARYAEWFQTLAGSSLSFDLFVGYLYSETTGYVDLYQPLLTYILSRFTSDSRILFAFFGLVYGFFYSRNLWFLLGRVRTRNSWTTFIIVLGFGLLLPIWNINGVRFWTASQIFLFGLLAYLLENDKRKIWVSVLAVFTHFSFFFPVVLLLIYAFTGNRRTLYFGFFIISIFLKELDFDFVKGFLENLPAVFQRKGETYLVEGSMERGLEQIQATNWYIRYYSQILNWISYVFLVGFYLNEKNKLKSNVIFNNLFSFVLLYYSFANIANLLPQGSRFFGVGNMLVFFLLAYFPYVIKASRVTGIIRKVSVPFVLITIIVNIRRGFDFTGVLAVLGNPVLALFFKDNVPLIDLVKQLF